MLMRGANGAAWRPRAHAVQQRSSLQAVACAERAHQIVHGQPCALQCGLRAACDCNVACRCPASTSVWYVEKSGRLPKSIFRFRSGGGVSQHQQRYPHGSLYTLVCVVCSRARISGPPHALLDVCAAGAAAHRGFRTAGGRPGPGCQWQCSRPTGSRSAVHLHGARDESWRPT